VGSGCASGEEFANLTEPATVGVFYESAYFDYFDESEIASIRNKLQFKEFSIPLILNNQLGSSASLKAHQTTVTIDKSWFNTK